MSVAQDPAKPGWILVEPRPTPTAWSKRPGSSPASRGPGRYVRHQRPDQVRGRREQAERVYRRLQPYPEWIIPFAVFPTSGVSYHLGLLAAFLRRFEDAEVHFATAAADHERIGAAGYLARTHLESARILLARGGPGDGERAQDLLRQARGTGAGAGIGRYRTGIGRSSCRVPVEERAGGTYDHAVPQGSAGGVGRQPPSFSSRTWWGRLSFVRGWARTSPRSSAANTTRWRRVRSRRAGEPSSKTSATGSWPPSPGHPTRSERQWPSSRRSHGTTARAAQRSWRYGSGSAPGTSSSRGTTVSARRSSRRPGSWRGGGRTDPRLGDGPLAGPVRRRSVHAGRQPGAEGAAGAGPGGPGRMGTTP